MSQSLNTKVKTATKWSTITELAAKLVAPITTMILARVLTPEAYGVVATITMVISFAELFTDAGFQKYLIQHEFSDDKEKTECTNVAFITNLVLSLFLWLVIGVFSSPIANIVGSPGMGNVITIACISIPLAAFSSIQQALYKRDFDFKTLFVVRMMSLAVPVLVTLPLAFIFKNFWALIIGRIVQDILNAVVLTVKSRWKPQFYYNWQQLKQMLSFSIWTIIESVSIWLTNYVDVFIVGTLLSQYYLGLYKTSMTTVSHILGLIISATSPILFSSLSRLQNDKVAFDNMFYRFQKTVALIVVPLGFGIFIFNRLITEILLGDQWLEAAPFIGLWALMATITIVFSYYASEVYRSMGMPKLSVLAQWLHIVVLVPVVLIFARKGFEPLYIARSILRLESVLVDCTLMAIFIKLSPWKMMKNVFPIFLSSVVMTIMGLFLISFSDKVIWSIVCVFICTGIYLAMVFLFKDSRESFLFLKKHILKKNQA